MGTLLHYLRNLVAVEGNRRLADRILLQRFVDQRDESAFAVLVERYAPLVQAACRRQLPREQDTEDALQATFLVLVRRAGSIRKHESIGSWLYGTAHRIARKLRAAHARQKERERVAAEARPAASPPRTWDDLGAVLDEELQALPDKYRAPLLLCCLMDKTRDEAAQELGWTLGAVKIRLERGRELLRSRLARRGIALSAALLATTVASAVVPVRTVAMIVEQAMRLSAGQPISSAVVQNLVTDMRRELGAAKVPVAVALLAGVMVIGLGMSGLARVAESSGPTATNEIALAPPTAKTDDQIRPEPTELPQDSSALSVADPLPIPGDTFSALLREVEPETQRVTLRKSEVNAAYLLSANAEIRIDGERATIADLAVVRGARVKVSLIAGGTQVLSLSAEGETFTGTVRGVDVAGNTVLLQRNATDSLKAPVTWTLAPNAEITLDGYPAVLSELREGIRALVRLSADRKRVLALDAISP